MLKYFRKLILTTAILSLMVNPAKCWDMLQKPGDYQPGGFSVADSSYPGVIIIKLKPDNIQDQVETALSEISKTCAIVNCCSVQQVGNKLNEGSRTTALIVFVKKK